MIHFYSTITFLGPGTREIKAVKSLLTLIKTGEIRIVIASLTLGMYLIPMFLSTTMCYVIIALQFNNVI